MKKLSLTSLVLNVLMIIGILFFASKSGLITSDTPTTVHTVSGKKYKSSNWYINVSGDYVLKDLGIIILKENFKEQRIPRD